MSTLFADVTPAPLFQDHTVLQRGKPVPVWGQADPGESVTVTFAGQTKSAVTDREGRWSVTLDALDVSAEPATLTIKGRNTLNFSDVLVGDVWLAAGQSNMGRTVSRSFDHALDVPTSANPLIRHIKIGLVASDEPKTTATGNWQSASPETTAKFTAVGYYFAREIQAHTGVPVGIVNCSWGDTRIESWIDAASYSTDPALAYITKRWTKEVAAYPERKAKYDADRAAWQKEKAATTASGREFKRSAPREPRGPGDKATPASIYNGMIHPLVPYSFRGIIWYQGESNAGSPGGYDKLFTALIKGWRTAFGQGDLPFYWVQLSNYSSPTATNWAVLREAQTEALSLPATGQAVTIDIGDQKDGHPLNKRDVGRRLARLALAREYGSSIIDSGPVFEKAEREGTGFRVTFKTGAKLHAPLNGLPGFEVAGADKVFHPAEAKIDGTSVVVTCDAVAEPVAVRYAWRNAPVAGLFNEEGLPAVPFRTDTW